MTIQQDLDRIKELSMTDEREVEEIARACLGLVNVHPVSLNNVIKALTKERELKKEAEQVLIPTQESLILAEGNLEKAETKFKHLDEKYDDLQKDYIELLKKWEASNEVD